MTVTFKKSEWQRLAHLRAVLQEVQAELSLPHLVALLIIAGEPGLSVNDLAERMNVPQQSASRYVSVLLARYETSTGPNPAFPLIAQGVSDDDPRKRSLLLTERGMDIVSKLLFREPKGSDA